MPLNDPHWGRNSSDEEPPRRDDQDENDDFREPELREPKNNDHEEPHAQETDLEDLWKQFNEKVNSIIGGGKKPSTPNQSTEHREPPRQQNEGFDFDEPPLRKGHPFGQPKEEKSSGSRFGGNGGSGGRKPPFHFNRPSSRGSASLLWIAIGLAFLGWVGSGFYIVPEGQRGVVTTFGKYSETTNPGFRWHMPYPVQDVDLVDVSSVRKCEIGMAGSAQRLKEALMLTDDENIVDVMFNVQYRIKDGIGAEEFIFRHKDPMAAVVQTAESAMREVVGRKKMDSVLFESKLEIAQEVQKIMQEMLDRYQSGIQVLSVAIQNAQPPEQVQAAFNDAVKAGQDRERQINEGEAYANDVVPKARGTAERLRQDAEGYKARVVSQAEGDASRFEQVLSEYSKAPKVTRDRMYIDALQQILNNTQKLLIDSKSSNNLLYLPLDKLIEKSARTPLSGSLPAAGSSTGTESTTSTASAGGSDYDPTLDDVLKTSRTLR